MKFIELFAGIGGFRLGLERTGHECVWANEWEKNARKVYEEKLGPCDGRDIRTVDAKQIPDHDLLVGGFPCQAFSIAGKRGGFEDTRGTLFFEIARILETKKPEHVLLENVRGLLSHNRGATFEIIIRTLGELGYCVEWQVLNSKYFGVPQNRERVFIHGFRKSSSRKIFPFFKASEEDASKEIIQLNNPVHSNNRIYSQDGLSPTLNTAQGGLRQPKIVVHSTQSRSADRPSLKYSSGGSGHLQKEDGTTYCLDTGNTQVVEFVDLKPETLRILGDVRPLGNYLPRERVMSVSGIARAVSTSESQFPFYESMTGVRRLTPLECERLQGFPDGWTASLSDSQRYKCLGNAVTVNVIEAIGAVLKE